MAIKNKEKPKAKTGSTALQEQGSLVALYYAYKKGANLNNGNGNKASKTAQLELDVALKKVYPAMNKAWYETFISQAKAILAPAPAATPLTAAIIGFSIFLILSIIGL